jgi:predicted nucleic acid-binding protein
LPDEWPAEPDHLALQFDLSFYDASYLELADRLKVPLHSADSRLMAAAKQLGLEG